MVKFNSYYIFSDSIENILLNNQMIISTINPYSFLIAEKDSVFKESLIDSDILLPDGEGIVWAIKFLYGEKIKKIAGFDIFIHLMKTLNKQEGHCFFFGSIDETLIRIREKAKIEYPKITVDYFSPPFKDKFSSKENDKFVSIINAKKPDVLFVGMTAPKQEKWVYINRDKLSVPIIVSIGAVFDFYAGNVKRPSKFWIDLGLEWLFRFVQEPIRLFKRNFLSISFVLRIFKIKFYKS